MSECFQQDCPAKLCDRSAKVVENPADVVISVDADWLDTNGYLLDVNGKQCFHVDKALWERCQQKRRENSGTQKGVPRCHDPYKYPLAGLFRCGHCRGVMHGIPAGQGLRYTCGTYINSGGGKCEHNWVCQENLLNDVLLTIREQVMPSSEELRATIRALTPPTSKERGDQRTAEITELRNRQTQLVKKCLEAVAAAHDDEERLGLRKIYQAQREKLETLYVQVCATEPTERIAVDDLVQMALDELKNFNRKMDTVNDRADVAHLLRELHVRVFLDFKKVLWGKRSVNRLNRGVVCVGSAPDPWSEVEGSDSLGMVNRGDRTPIELFQQGAPEIEPSLQPFILGQSIV